MEAPSAYRAQAARARDTAMAIAEPQMCRNFWDLAQELDELADDLERGRNRFRHPEWLPVGEAAD